jgi:hypothetical protein
MAEGGKLPTRRTSSRKSTRSTSSGLASVSVKLAGPALTTALSLDSLSARARSPVEALMAHIGDFVPKGRQAQADRTANSVAEALGFYHFLLQEVVDGGKILVLRKDKKMYQVNLG